MGTSRNALLTQIWTALIAILVLMYLKFRSTLGWSLSNLVAMLRYNLFTYRDLWTWLGNPFETPPMAPAMEQFVFQIRQVGQENGEPKFEKVDLPVKSLN